MASTCGPMHRRCWMNQVKSSHERKSCSQLKIAFNLTELPFHYCCCVVCPLLLLMYRHFTQHSHLFTASKPSPLRRCWYAHLFFSNLISSTVASRPQSSSWISANLLTPNSSKTEFLIIDHKKQLAEMLITQNTAHSAICMHPWFIFHERLSFSDQN